MRPTTSSGSVHITWFPQSTPRVRAHHSVPELKASDTEIAFSKFASNYRKIHTMIHIDKRLSEVFSFALVSLERGDFELNAPKLEDVALLQRHRRVLLEVRP